MILNPNQKARNIKPRRDNLVWTDARVEQVREAAKTMTLMEMVYKYKWPEASLRSVCARHGIQPVPQGNDRRRDGFTAEFQQYISGKW